MTTSGTTNSTLTVRQIINQALSLLGMLPAGGTPSAADANTSMTQLNFMLKSMQADGCNLWRDRDAIITWPANTTDGQLDPAFLDVFDVRWIAGQNYQRFLARVEKGEYDTYPNPSASGSPTTYCVHKERDQLRMYVWPVPTQISYFKADVSTIIEDVTALDQTIDVPQMWLECVYYNLADRLMPIFGTSNQQISARAAQLYSAMRDWDRPGSITMGPW